MKMHISNVYIKNIGCFKKVDIPFENKKNGEPYSWNMIVGDNASGKTCLLRCIAIGLCDEASAAALMKELEGNFRRKRAREGEIIISLKDSKNVKNKLEIKTWIKPEHGNEIVKKDFGKNYHEFQDKIFICGYGVQRTGETNLSFRKYSIMEAVYSLFNYLGPLQNPELILRRHGPKTREAFFRKLEKILMLDTLDQSGFKTPYSIKLKKKGVTIKGPWGDMFLDDMSDGYFSTFAWLVDFLGWQTYASPKWIVELENLKGIVLLDEIELHLHPSWQRHIVHRLKQQFPGVQFITTTHSPIAAAGAADFDDANHIVLRLLDGVGYFDKEIPSLQGKRFDEILTSKAFGLFATRSPGSIKLITRYSELASKKRDEEDEKEFQQLRDSIAKELPIGETKADQIIRKAIRVALPKILKDLKEQIPQDDIDLEMKQQLKDLLGL